MFSQIIPIAIEALFVLAVASAIIVVLLDNRQPVKAMAWILVLLFLPVVGLVLFYFFGQDVRKQRLISRKSMSLLLRRAMQRYKRQPDLKLPRDCERLISFFEQQNTALPLADNHIDIFTSGVDFIDNLIADVNSARSHVHLESFIFLDDATGCRVRDALVAAARRGVLVRVIYDDVGSWGAKSGFFAQMQAEGIDVVCFQPVRFPRLTRRVNYRNHRKVAVVDGRVGYVGGMNIADRYLYGRNGEGWHDMHLRIEGCAVYGLQQNFLVDWYFMTRVLINDPLYYPEIRSPRLRADLVMQIVSSSPAAQWPDIMLGMTWAVLNAKRYVYIATPYFMPTETFLEALQTAAMSGVDVRLMVTARPDGRWVKLANESYFRNVLEAGVRLYRYGPAFHHSKYLVADDSLSTVGSTNIDFRSFLNDFELNAFIYDADVSARIRDSFLADLGSCQQVSLADWLKRPLIRRFLESFARLLSPLF